MNTAVFDRNAVYADGAAKIMIDALTEETPRYRNPTVGGRGPTMMGQYNPVTGIQYRGSNQFITSMVAVLKNYDDDRWLTYKQGRALGGQVRKGERGVMVRYYKAPQQEESQGEDEKPLKGRMYFATVFNAAQFDGLPERPPLAWPRPEIMHVTAEKVIAASGVKILHDTDNLSYYSASRDEVHLPPRESFRSEAAFYGTLLHELGHATGHHSRLGRDMRGKFGSPEYAREELRAEIASLMMSQRIHVQTELGQHKAYVKSWIAILEEKPAEILKACADAERICHFLGVHAPEHERLPLREQSQAEKDRISQGVAQIKQIEAQSQEQAKTRAKRPSRARKTAEQER